VPQRRNPARAVGSAAFRLEAALALLGALAHPIPAAGAPASRNPDPMRAIAIAEDRRHYTGLRGYLSSRDPAVRLRAVRAAGRLQDSTTVKDLLSLLRDSDREVRREAAFALGQIGHRSARGALEGLLAGDDVELVDLAIEALGKIGDHASTPRVASYLGNPSPLLRGEAAVALWRLADSTALEGLLERHNDLNAEVRWRVLYALEKIVEPDRVVPAVTPHLDDSEWLVRAYAARTLGRQKSARATASLISALADHEPAVVVNALRSLQQIADSTCVPCARVLTRLLDQPHPYVRVTAATALAERFALAKADSVARRAALDSLGAHLEDPDAATRGACGRALLSIRGEAALGQVRPLLSDPSIYSRVAVLQSLARLPAATAAPLLLARLDPGSPLFERMTAAEALGTLKAPSALPALRAGLADSSVLFVASCAGALSDLGDTASVPALAQAYGARAGEADADARISIRDALRSLAGRTFADSVERLHPARNAAPEDYPPDFQLAPAVRGAVLETTAGRIEWAFYGREAPGTVRNFVRLAERGYFDGLSIHRVVPNFVIQDGDPTGTGSGGPGYTIRCEYNRLRYEPGMVGMALSGKDTGGSQWFITHSPQPHLNGRYTIFARVTQGMDVVRRIVQGDRVLRVELLK